jgi:hypothetical protein
LLTAYAFPVRRRHVFELVRNGVGSTVIDPAPAFPCASQMNGRHWNVLALIAVPALELYVEMYPYPTTYRPLGENAFGVRNVPVDDPFDPDPYTISDGVTGSPPRLVNVLLFASNRRPADSVVAGAVVLVTSVGVVLNAGLTPVAVFPVICGDVFASTASWYRPSHDSCPPPVLALVCSETDDPLITHRAPAPPTYTTPPCASVTLTGVPVPSERSVGCAVAAPAARPSTARAVSVRVNRFVVRCMDGLLVGRSGSRTAGGAAGACRARGPARAV